MPNRFYHEYIQLKEEMENYRYFTEETIAVNEEVYTVLKLNIDERILNHAINIATAKETYVMDFNQAGEIRTNSVKFNNLFKGILAEIGAQLYLEETLNLQNVKRWDLERHTFKYLPQEFDLKFSKENREIFCESRSSVSFKTTLEEFIERYHVIGPYTNRHKFNEKDNDIYFRPVYQYSDKKATKTLSEKDVTNSINDIRNGDLSLYFVSGATLDEMNGENSEISNNNQRGTSYRQIRITHCGDMRDFREKLNNI